MMFVDKAHGKWTWLLQHAGISADYLDGRHHACPLCGGKDRFRYDGHKNGRGSSFCNACGARDGVQLLMDFKGWSFKEAADWVEEQAGNAMSDKTVYRPRNTSHYLDQIWKRCQTISRDNETGRYLMSRNITGLNRIASANILHINDLKLDDHSYPAMIGLIRDPRGQRVNIHRTWLKPDGSKVRKIGPGCITDGSAIRLGPVAETMAVAEGVETALSFMLMHKVPTWALVSNRMLEKWVPPEGCKRVIIAGDADKNFQGQASAYALACKLSLKGYDVEVRIPEKLGVDWNDLHVC